MKRVGKDRDLNEQQLSELTAELTKATTAKAEALARADQAREVTARGGGETLADVQKSALVPRLVEQRVRLERNSPSCRRRCCPRTRA